MENQKFTHEDYLKLQQEYQEKEKSMQERIWTDSNISQFDELLRQNYSKSTEDFATVVIEYLAELTNAYRGVFYSYNQENKIAKAIAGYACKIPKLSKSTFEKGEGMVGQVVTSHKTLFFNDLPKDSNEEVSQTSVMLSPAAIIIIPLMFNDMVYGVIELVYLSSLTPKYQFFLTKINKNIGAMLESIYSAAKMNELLKATQEQAEMLRSQEEEMRQNMEEMTTTQEEMERRQKELQKSNKKMEANETILRKSLEKSQDQQKELEELKAKYKKLEESYKKREEELLEEINLLQKVK